VACSASSASSKTTIPDNLKESTGCAIRVVAALDGGKLTNAVCISYAAITWPDGSRYGWLGDIGYLCRGIGAPWYHAYTYVGNLHRQG